MAKAAKKAADSSPGDDVGKPASSYLAAAYYYFERGDEARTRKFATHVVNGQATAADGEAAKHLAKKLSTADRAVGEDPKAVAAELILRTEVPAKPYLFGAVAAGIFVLLLTIAITRYA